MLRFAGTWMEHSVQLGGGCTWMVGLTMRLKTCKPLRNSLKKNGDCVAASLDAGISLLIWVRWGKSSTNDEEFHSLCFNDGLVDPMSMWTWSNWLSGTSQDSKALQMWQCTLEGWYVWHYLAHRATCFRMPGQMYSSETANSLSLDEFSSHPLGH